MASWPDALKPRPQHDALCASVLAVARAAGARLAIRDAADGFIHLSHGHRTQLQQRGERVAEHVAVLLAAWRLAEAAPGGGPLARVGAIAAHDEERVLLSLCAAPQLDRALGRAFRAVAHPGGELTIGAALDLASTEPSNRILLAGLFHPDAPLRRAALVATDFDGAALASMSLEVAPAVLSALRGEPIAAPDGAEAVAATGDPAAAPVAARLGLAAPRAGTVTVLCGPRSATTAALRILALASGRAAWIIPGGAPFRDAAGHYPRWRSWARDAALADALVAADLDGLAVDDTCALARAAAAATGATPVLLATGAVGAADPRIAVVPCARLGQVRADDDAPLAEGLAPGRLRRAVEALAGLA